MSRSSDEGRAPGPALQLLRVLLERRESGTLELESFAASRTLRIHDGEIWLPSGHPLSELARGTTEQRSLAARRFAQSLLDQPSRHARFDPSPAAPGAEGGPRIAVASVLRWTARLASDAVWPRRLLPAQDVALVAAERLPPSAEVDGWAPEELWVLERLRQPMSLGELLDQSPMDAAALRATLAGLVLSGFVRLAGEPPATAADPAALAERLRDRMAASLAEKPLELDGERYRERVASLLARAGGLNHYELLGVASDAGAAEIAAAFEDLARLVHPSNAGVYELEGQRRALDYLFEQACRAYQTLSDLDARIVYDRRHQIEAAAVALPESERRAEAAALARSNFRRAVDEEAMGDLHTALQLLEQVVRIDPRAEYWRALARLQCRNVAWLTRAIESLKSALELDPQSSEIRYELATLLERRGDFPHARALYQSAASGTPPHPGARAALARLDADRADGAGGLFGKLLGRS